MSRAHELLAAGAVLPADTSDAGERAVPLTARAYRHPGLDGRTVVRLVPAELGRAEDLVAGFLGLEPADEPAPVGLGRTAALGFPEWVLVHHPQDGHHALAVLPELERLAQRAKSKPKATLQAFYELAGRLASSVPHLLPTFYEQMAREYLALDNQTTASQLFTRARNAEAEHGLEIDEDRLDAVFLEFALAGALQVKTLSGYATALADRLSPDEALRRFSRLCVRRTSGGLPPSAKMATDLRRLAKAAGGDAQAAERAYLAEVLAFPATLRAAPAWWKAHREALAALAAERPEVRGALLNMLPQYAQDKDLPALWLELLEASGATAALCDPRACPEEARPEDGTLGWFKRFTTFWTRMGRYSVLPALLPLTERMADRLKAELAESGERLAPPQQADLLDLLLVLDVPLADPTATHTLRLEAWSRTNKPRDLLALSGDPRFRASFHRSAEQVSGNRNDKDVLQRLLSSPGGRPMLADWTATVAREAIAPGLPGLPRRLQRLEQLPGEVMALAEEGTRAVAAADLAPILARTLRTGLFSELHWPAWEEAMAALGSPASPNVLVADAWPYLVVANRVHARVIGPEGTVLAHDLRIPAGDLAGDPGFQYVDGELLVHWQTRKSRTVVGYWHTAPDRQRPFANGHVRSMRLSWHPLREHSLALPGGGRTTGDRPLYPGDTALPVSRNVISDGRSYWVWRAVNGGQDEDWHEYDPKSGEHGRRGRPAFFSDAVRGLPEGSAFASGTLLPAPSQERTATGAPVDGLVGWRVVRLPDGSLRGEDLAGNTVTTPRGVFPSSLLFIPEDDEPRALVRSHGRIELVDSEGVITAEVRTDYIAGSFGRRGTPLPPLGHWYGMRPRDPRGSQALRSVGLETASALMKAVLNGEETTTAVRVLLPDVTHETLVAGVAAAVEFAAGQYEVLERIEAKLNDALEDSHQAKASLGPNDGMIRRALLGFGSTGYNSEEPAFATLLGTMRRARDGEFDQRRPATHWEGIRLPHSELKADWLLASRAALAYRAVSALTPPDDRKTLVALLEALAETGMTGEHRDHWRLVRLEVSTSAMGKRRAEECHLRALLPLGGGAFLAVTNHEHLSSGARFSALFHDPEGRFEAPAGYEMVSSAPLIDPDDAFSFDGLAAEAAERGPAPWSPAAAEEFARLTGVTPSVAKLVVAGLPGIDGWGGNFLPAETRTALGLKVADATVAKEELRELGGAFRRELVGALVPSEPVRLWTEGPDAAAAAEVWNTRLGARPAVPETLVAEASKALRIRWGAARALRAVLGPESAPELNRDMNWTVRGNGVVFADGGGQGFSSVGLVGAAAAIAWLAHRLPAGDPLRVRLPDAVSAVRDRLAHPGLLLRVDRYVNVEKFRKAAGNPSETGEGYERYGAVVLPTNSNYAYPGIKAALLDEEGGDPYLPALREGSAGPSAIESSLRLVRDERFAALLADPGDPAAGERAADGTWWPQDPSRSVPDLVAEAADRHGLSPDAAAVYLMLLAMPDPTDRNTARWTGWKPARIKAARAELAATDLVVEAQRARAGRSLFLPGGWAALSAPHPPQEEWKLPLYDLVGGSDARPPLEVLVPLEPAADLYRRAWARITEGDVPRFADLEIRRGRRR